LRAVEINVSGKFLRSKIAWKLATYQHVLLHRLVALMDGAAVACHKATRRYRSSSSMSPILLEESLWPVLAGQAGTRPRSCSYEKEVLDAVVPHDDRNRRAIKEASSERKTFARCEPFAF
jgi:hypothetical protein